MRVRVLLISADAVFAQLAKKEAHGLSLDLVGARRFALLGIETIDLTGSGDNSVVLNAVVVAALSGEATDLRILGDAGDVAVIGPGWVFEGPVSDGGLNFSSYRQGVSRLLIEDAVLVAERL